jgi:hypothetical protein
MAIEVTQGDRDAAALIVKTLEIGDWAVGHGYYAETLRRILAEYRTESIAAYLDALIASLPDDAVEAAVNQHQGAGYGGKIAMRAAITAALKHMKGLNDG